MLTSGLLHAPFYFYVSYAMLRYLFHDDEVTRDEYFATARRLHRRGVGLRLRFSARPGRVARLVLQPGRAPIRRGSSCSTCPSPRSPASACPTSWPSALQARSLVMLEMMAGVFYIALVVSRMVGLTMMRHRCAQASQPSGRSLRGSLDTTSR